jgi:hypothetical protein
MEAEVPVHRVTPALLTLLVVLRPAPLAAEDPPPERAPALCVFPVGALVQGRYDHMPSRVGPVASHAVSDAAHPLFGAEGEEPFLPVGNADELVETVRRHLGTEPDEAGYDVDLRPTRGTHLLARARPEARARIGALLKGLEDRCLRSLAVDVVALRLPKDAPAAPEAAQLAAWVAGAEAGPGLTLACLPGQRVTGFVGRQQTYVADYDVEVASKATITDPIVGVLPTGLSVACRATPSDAATGVRVDMDAQLALLRSLEPLDAGAGRRLESPLVERLSARITADLEPGVWTLVDGAGSRSSGRSWAFAVRARVGARAVGAASSGRELPTLVTARGGTPTERTIDVARLTRPVLPSIPVALDLIPSDYTPPEPPELPEPLGPLSDEALLGLLREGVAPAAWNAVGAWLELGYGTLRMRAAPEAVEGAERMLGALEAAFRWSLETDVEVLDAPAELELTPGTLLEPRQSAALAAAVGSGAAARLDRVRVTSYAGARSHAVVGDERTIVADYDVEIAEQAEITRPVVLPLRTGVVVDLAPGLASTGDAATFSVRFTRSEQVSLRNAASAAGEIQCPEVRMLKLRLDLEVPFGRTGVVGAALEGGRRTVVLLTPRLVAGR